MRAIAGTSFAVFMGVSFDESSVVDDGWNLDGDEAVASVTTGPKLQDDRPGTVLRLPSGRPVPIRSRVARGTAAPEQADPRPPRAAVADSGKSPVYWSNVVPEANPAIPTFIPHEDRSDVVVEALAGEALKPRLADFSDTEDAFFQAGEELALGTVTDDFADLAGEPVGFWQRFFRTR